VRAESVFLSAGFKGAGVEKHIYRLDGGFRYSLSLLELERLEFDYFIEL